jgi:hypothetical protein
VHFILKSSIARFLAGEGAKSWAQSNGIPVCSNEELISSKSYDDARISIQS